MTDYHHPPDDRDPFDDHDRAGRGVRDPGDGHRGRRDTGTAGAGDDGQAGAEEDGGGNEHGKDKPGGRPGRGGAPHAEPVTAAQPRGRCGGRDVNRGGIHLVTLRTPV